MNTQISSQVAKVRQAIFAPETAATYQQAIALTGVIIAETTKLLWLLLCGILVLGEWTGKSGFQAGQSFRNWLTDIEKPSTDRVLSEAGKALLSAGKSSVTSALSGAKEQLGIVEEPVATPTVGVKSIAPLPPTPVTLPPTVVEAGKANGELGNS